MKKQETAADAIKEYYEYSSAVFNTPITSYSIALEDLRYAKALLVHAIRVTQMEMYKKEALRIAEEKNTK